MKYKPNSAEAYRSIFVHILDVYSLGADVQLYGLLGCVFFLVAYLQIDPAKGILGLKS